MMAAFSYIQELLRVYICHLSNSLSQYEAAGIPAVDVERRQLEVLAVKHSFCELGQHSRRSWDV